MKDTWFNLGKCRFSFSFNIYLYGKIYYGKCRLWKLHWYMSHTTACYIATKSYVGKNARSNQQLCQLHKYSCQKPSQNSGHFDGGKKRLRENLWSVTHWHMKTCEAKQTNPFSQSQTHASVNWPFSDFFFSPALSDKQIPFNDRIRSRMAGSKASHQGLPSLTVSRKQCYVYSLHCWD